MNENVKELDPKEVEKWVSNLQHDAEVELIQKQIKVNLVREVAIVLENAIKVYDNATNECVYKPALSDRNKAAVEAVRDAISFLEDM